MYYALCIKNTNLHIKDSDVFLCEIVNSKDASEVTDSSRGLKCKTFCKMCSCKNSAKIFQIFLQQFYTIFLKIFLNFFTIFLQFFATFLQFFCKLIWD